MNEKTELKNTDTLGKYITSSISNSPNEDKTSLVVKNQPDVENNTNPEDSPILAENTKHNEETLRKLWMVSAICLVFMIIEIIGGYLASSIAIMSDAAHLLSDFLGFMISIVSIYISRRKATDKMSFGYHRAEVIGALVSVNIIWGLTIWLLYEASLRLIYQQPVNGFIMLVTAVIGFLFNVIMGLVLMSQGIDHNLHHHHDHEHDPQLSSGDSNDSHHSHSKKEHSHDHYDHEHKNGDLNLKSNLKEKLLDGKEKAHNHNDHKHEHDHSHHDGHDNHSHSHGHDDHHGHGHHHGHSHHDNLNMKAALVHVIGDAVQNLGVVIAGVIIYYKPDYSIADPICTFIFSIIVIFTTTRILKDCLSVLMEGSPLDFEIDTLRKDLRKISGVIEVHDLHVWSLSVGKLSLSCHIISDNPQLTLREASNLCRNKYKIKHSTIQVESSLEKFKHDCDHDMH